MNTRLIVAIAISLMLLGGVVFWLGSRGNMPPATEELLHHDLFGQPIAQGEAVAEPFSPSKPREPDRPAPPATGDNAAQLEPQDSLIGPRQSFKPPEIIAYA